LLPHFVALFEELQSPEFKAKGGETQQVHLFSINALSAAPDSPHMHALNNSMLGLIEILDWTDDEAQRGKDFLDAHFSHMLKQTKKVILQVEIKFTDQHTFHDSLTCDSGMTASAALLIGQQHSPRRGRRGSSGQPHCSSDSTHQDRAEEVLLGMEDHHQSVTSTQEQSDDHVDTRDHCFSQKKSTQN
jgi:hypothetical protein